VNIRLTIEFDGSGYAGWQFQPGRPTVQGELEAALRCLLGRKTTVYGCGRTDAGVSARGYVANFHAEAGGRLLTDAERLRRAINHYLPADIHVRAAEPAPDSFHARHSARAKTYAYHIARGISPLRRARAWEVAFPLSVAKLRRAARLFTGTRDFNAFCHTGDATGRCTVEVIDVSESGDELTVTVRGDRFLYKMVRRIVGAMVTYGLGRVTLKDLAAALAGRPHTPFQTAPAAGLVLDAVLY